MPQNYLVLVLKLRLLFERVIKKIPYENMKDKMAEENCPSKKSSSTFSPRATQLISIYGGNLNIQTNARNPSFKSELKRKSKLKKSKLKPMTMTMVTMIYNGKSVKMQNEKDEIILMQQHCGSSNLCVYSGHLKAGGLILSKNFMTLF